MITTLLLEMPRPIYYLDIVLSHQTHGKEKETEYKYDMLNAVAQIQLLMIFMIRPNS